MFKTLRPEAIHIGDRMSCSPRRVPKEATRQQNGRRAEKPDRDVVASLRRDFSISPHEQHEWIDHQPNKPANTGTHENAQAERLDIRNAGVFDVPATFATGNFGLGSDPQKVEHPENAREQGRSYAESRQGDSVQAGDEGGVSQTGEGLGNEGNEERRGETDERPMRLQREGMGSVGQRECSVHLFGVIGLCRAPFCSFLVRSRTRKRARTALCSMTKTGEWNASVRANPSGKSDVGDRLRPSCSRKAGDQEPGPCREMRRRHPRSSGPKEHRPSELRGGQPCSRSESWRCLPRTTERIRRETQIKGRRQASPCSRGVTCDTSLHFSPPDGRSTRKKAVFRVSCLVIRENHGRASGSLQKKCLRASEPERPCFLTRGVQGGDLSSTPAHAFSSARLAPFSSARLAPSLHFSPPDGRSTRHDRQGFVALACRAQRTVQVRLRAPSGSRLFPPPGLRLVLTALSRTSSRRALRNAG